MYKIVRNDRRFNKFVFESYEKARQYVRKWLRKHLDVNGNAPISKFNFTITKVA